MRVLKYQSEDGPRLGLQEAISSEFDADGKIFDLTRALELYLHDTQTKGEFRDGSDLAAAGLLEAHELGGVVRFMREEGLEKKLQVEGPVRLLAPIGRPGKIIALGMNYQKHAKELEWEKPEEPIIFEKASSAVIGPGEGVICRLELERIDPEVELAVVIGHTAKAVGVKEALRYVGGYTVLNDMTARSMQKRDMEARRPWFRSKSLDTFCPLGPAVVLCDEIKDPDNLRLELRVNGEKRQSASTTELIFNVRFLIEYISRYITLEPGDIIATGTPEGIAPVKPGDMMEAWVEGIGKLINPVVAG